MKVVYLFLSISFLLASCSMPGMKMEIKQSSNGMVVDSISGVKIKYYKLADVLSQKIGQNNLQVLPDSLFNSDKKEYVLGVNDVVVVTVWDHPELSIPLGQYQISGQLIDNNGIMFYPHVGEVKVAGLTLTQLRALLLSKLAIIYQNPQVDVKILNYRSKILYVGGAVKVPGVLNFDDVPMTLPQAIARSGGMTERADASEVLLIRGEKVFKVNYFDLFKSGNALEKILLKEGDKLYVTSSEENKVFVLGEVKKPSSIPITNGNLTLAQALADVGGIETLSADAKSIFVIRYASDNTIHAYQLEAENPIALVLADKFRLSPRDIVFVDTHNLAQWNRFMGLIAPTMNFLYGGTNTIESINTLIK